MGSSNNIPLSLKENGIAILSNTTGTWNVNGNDITIRFGGGSLIFNGTVNSDKTQITGNYIIVTENGTSSSTFVMNKTQGKVNTMESKVTNTTSFGVMNVMYSR